MGISKLLLGILLTMCTVTTQISATEDNGRVEDPSHVVSRLDDSRIDEASGLATSRRHKDILYTHNDSGGRTRVFAIQASTGMVKAIINIVGDDVRNCDWEDIAVGPSSQQSNIPYIYIGDIGGNTRHKCNVIYRVEEPETLSESMHLQVDGILKFSYGAGNAETLMVDEKGVVWLVSKVHSNMHPHLFRVPPEAWLQTGVLDLGEGVEMPVTFERESPTGGDVSVDGQWIILKGYRKVVAYQRQNNQTLEETLVNSTGHVMPYIRERQGEAICWRLNVEGYYTLSEGLYQYIWYYNNTMKFDEDITWIISDYNGSNSLYFTPVLYSITVCLFLCVWSGSLLNL